MSAILSSPALPLAAPPAPLLVPGRTCWRLERAERVTLIVDGADYFAAARAALRRARHSILLIGWDLDTRIPLLGDEGDGLPESVGGFLDAVVANRPALNAHVLKWDYAMIFALEREHGPMPALEWLANPRIALRLDGGHPVGACHHQKLLVIDDAVAFCGGLDFTADRWDTRAHRDDEPRRRRTGGRRHGPFHDVMLAVDGAAAAALGELARERWRRATGERLAPPPPPDGDPDGDPWPPHLRPDLCGVGVGIARTDPAWCGRPPVHEVEALFLDAIAAASSCIYLESQYFASGRIASALAGRLAEPDGPEVVVVNPVRTRGWLEHGIMGPARRRLVQGLRSADRFGRFRIYAPLTETGKVIMVHSKFMTVDDRLLRVGSANLNNRSMGLDSECDLAIEAAPAGADAERRTIAACRDGLIAEHLGAPPEMVTALHRRTGSLIRTIEVLRRRSGRTLVPLEAAPISRPILRRIGGGRIAGFIVDNGLLDPERPVSTEVLLRWLPAHRNLPWQNRLKYGAGFLMLVTVLVLLGAVWQANRLGDPATVDAVLDAVQGVAGRPWGPLALIGLFLAGGFIGFPVTGLVAATAVVLGPVAGFLTALAGCLASAAALFTIGRLVSRFGGRYGADRLAGSLVDRISRRLAARGVLTVAVLRVLPLAPFTVVNLVAGASHLRFTDYMLGTVIGMAPGIFTVSLLGGQIESVLRDPRPSTLALLVGLGAVAIGLGWVANRVLGDKGGWEIR